MSDTPSGNPVPETPVPKNSVPESPVSEAAAPEAAASDHAAPADTAPACDIPDYVASGAFLFQLSNLTRNTLPEGYPADPGFEEALLGWAGARMSGNHLNLFRALFSADALKKVFESGKTSCTFDYDDPEDDKLTRRLSMHLLSDPESGDLLCVSSLKSFPRETDAAEAVADDSPFHAVIRSYRLFFAVDPDQPQIYKSSVYRDQDGLAATVSLPCPFRAFLKAVAARYIRSAWEDEFLSALSLDQLKDAVSRGQSTLTRTFSADGGPLRVEVYLPEAGDEDRRCYFGLGSAEENTGSALAVTAQDSAAMHAAYEDLQLSMQMERDETRKKHRRVSVLLVLFTVVMGVVGGSVLMQRLPDYAAFFSRFFPAPVEEVPVETPPPAEEVEIVVPDTVVEYVPFTAVKEFKADLMENGLPRDGAHNENYETLDVSLSVVELLTPEWFEAQYGKEGYSLDGTESGLHLSLNFAAGEDLASLIPQDSFPMRVVDAEGNTLQGYQLMDAPIGGKYNFKVSADTAADLYKRCESIGDARYLVVTFWRDGTPHELRFSLRYDDPNVDYDTLQSGDRGPFVQAMKEKLVSLGYLSERAAKGDQFNKDTVRAVQTAQEAFGMEKTGIADSAFLKTLYSK